MTVRSVSIKAVRCSPAERYRRARLRLQPRRAHTHPGIRSSAFLGLIEAFLDDAGQVYEQLVTLSAV